MAAASDNLVLPRLSSEISVNSTPTTYEQPSLLDIWTAFSEPLSSAAPRLATFGD